jgi:hypothetical protein
MIPIPVVWTKYTATLRGRVLKLVPCEDCSTEYVYVLEREGQGVGTSVYRTNDEGAQEHAATAAADTLREYLENDFDPVPCPACGHYQRYMVPKLYEATPSWLPAVRLLVVAAGSLCAVAALYSTLTYVQRPGSHALEQMAAAWAVLAALGLLGAGLGAVERSRARRFDPNAEDQQARIRRGRSRAVTRAEFEAAQQPERGAGAPGHGAEAGPHSG